jgi:hypothetical protein
VSSGLVLRAYLNSKAVRGEKAVFTAPVRIKYDGACDEGDIFTIFEERSAEVYVNMHGAPNGIRRFDIVDSLTSQVLLTYGRDERTEVTPYKASFVAHNGSSAFHVTLVRSNP